MGFITEQEAEQKQARGEKLNRYNCGWNLSNNDIARISVELENWKPQNEIEKRDKEICTLAFIKNMNAQQIKRLNHPLIIGMGNRSNGKPLSVTSILKICYQYFPFVKESRKGKRPASHEKRVELFKEQQKANITKPKICAACGATEDIKIHHIIPLSMGGTNDYFNLVYLCHSCHVLLHNSIYKGLQQSKISK